MGFQLTITEGKGHGKEFHFTKDVVRVGRLPDNDLVLYDTGVSRYHCELLNNDGVYTLRDIGSANGTTLNEVITTEGEVKDGDRIGVGPIIFVFVRTDDPAPSRRRLTSTAQAAVERPDDDRKRKLFEEDKTKALSREDIPEIKPLESSDSAVGPVSVARTATGSFMAYRRTQRFSISRMPRSTRVALLTAAGVVVVAAVVSAYFFKSQPRTDRSAEVFPINGETALLKFGHGKVDVYTPDRASFKFHYGGGRVTLSYAAGGVDSEKELAVLVNGEHVAFVEKSPKWHKGLSTEIPRTVLKPGQNVVTFDNVYTPDRTETWGLTQLQLIQQVLPPPDRKRARELFKLGQAAHETRSVAPQNLYKSIQYFRDASLLLEGLDDPPPLMDDIRAALLEAEEELQSIHNSHTFTAQKAIRFGNLGEAADTLRNLLRYYPDPEDRRHKDVKSQLGKVLQRRR